jgi:putative addiction module component (TIGR02574 family)
MPAEQHAEIERRLAAVNDGTMPVYPWEDVRHRLLNRR